jgi:hypothetical protein
MKKEGNQDMREIFLPSCTHSNGSLLSWMKSASGISEFARNPHSNSSSWAECESAAKEISQVVKMTLFRSLIPHFALVTVLNSPSNRVKYFRKDICLSEIYDPACVKANGRNPSLTATCLAESPSVGQISLYSKIPKPNSGKSARRDSCASAMCFGIKWVSFSLM